MSALFTNGSLDVPDVDFDGKNFPEKDIKVFQGSANTKFVPSGGNKIGAFKMKR